jgi:hypothetical protein
MRSMVIASTVVRGVPPSASPEQAAAIVAALAAFIRATTPAVAAAAESTEPWRRAAVLEGVARELSGDLPDPWINT